MLTATAHRDGFGGHCRFSVVAPAIRPARRRVGDGSVTSRVICTGRSRGWLRCAGARWTRCANGRIAVRPVAVWTLTSRAAPWMRLPRALSQGARHVEARRQEDHQDDKRTTKTINCRRNMTHPRKRNPKSVARSSACVNTTAIIPRRSPRRSYIKPLSPRSVAALRARACSSLGQRHCLSKRPRGLMAAMRQDANNWPDKNWPGAATL